MAPAAGALAADTAWDKPDKIDGVELSTEFSQITPEPKGPNVHKLTAKEEAVKKQLEEASKFLQTLDITDGRSKIILQSANFFLGKGTFIIYDAATKKYVLANPTKKDYHALTGQELGNLFEGGPPIERNNYQVSIKDTPDKEKVAGFDTIKSEVSIAFKWKVKFKDSTKTGDATLKMLVWHTADAKFKPDWAKLMIDFVGIPFQDPEGEKVLDTLKAKLKFPLKWQMEENANLGNDRVAPQLVTTVTKVDFKQFPKSDFMFPPKGYNFSTLPVMAGAAQAQETADPTALQKLREKPGKRNPNDKPSTEAVPQ